MEHLIIMAGGVGSRFWPMSTPERPKQFIDVLGTGNTLLQDTVYRFGHIVRDENIWVVTSRHYYDLVKKQLPFLDNNHILLEPCRRNTAPCIAYATWKIKKYDPEASLIIAPADHNMTDVEEFRRVIQGGVKFVKTNDGILTLGITPSHPETGYGYIQSGKALKEEKICKVKAFKEKPDYATASVYLREGGYYWNSGIFLVKACTMEQALRQNLPEMAKLFDNLDSIFYTAAEQNAIDRSFPSCPNISIDYAVMEHADNIYVYPASFGWSDLGTWGALYEQAEKDAAGNALVAGNVKMVESTGCIVHVPAGKKIVVQGLQDYIIAEENGVLLICRKTDEQRIKDFSELF